MKPGRPGRTILFSVAALTAAGGLLADLNKTHIFNKRWTPHSKFHDAMTILLAAMLGTSSLYLLQKKGGDKNMQLEWGALLPAFFWSSMLGSFAFPGAKGLEAEFPGKVKKAGPIPLNEGFTAVIMLTLISAGYLIEKKDIG